jgi:hypothetical protein
MTKRLCLLLLWFSAALTSAAEHNTVTLKVAKEKVEHAIVKVEQTKRSHWSYTLSRFENEEGDISSSIEEYLPQLPQPWNLKQINTEPPTKKEIKSYIKKKKKQKVESDSNIKLTLRELINNESLSIKSIDENYIVMEFNVSWKKLGPDSNGKLKGKLFYEKQNKFIERIVIWNVADFSPLFTAEINELAVTFTFVHINGSVLPKQNEMIMKGSFAYFTEINETSVDTYSDYFYQGE